MTTGPFLLGLTGSIGMGKSTTAGIFRELGVPVWDADAAVHRLYAKGGAAVPRIAELCPEAVQDGTISREVLSEWITRDPDALTRIEAVVHPLVAADRAAFIAEHDDRSLLLLDIPLLFETGAEETLDAVLVVTANPDVQRARVLSRPGMTEERFEMILARQVPDVEKRSRADHVIETRSLEQTRAEVQALVETLRGSHA